jgi:hypothetical protein
MKNISPDQASANSAAGGTDSFVEPLIQMADMQALICHLLMKNQQLRMELSAWKMIDRHQVASEQAH